jgi:hypothetical protein
MGRIVWILLAAAAGFVLPPGGLHAPAFAEAGSVAQLFEKYDLIGVFAADCGKPVSPRNLYFVHRVIDGDHVQHDQMSGPATSDFAFLIDQAAEVRPNELALGGTIETRRLSSVIRAERQHMRIIESTRVTTAAGRPLPEGERVVVAGRFTNGVETPWLNKCTP